MSTLEEIKKGVEACRTYNFGMRYADKLAHEDADKLIAALEAVEALSRTWNVAYEEHKAAEGCITDEAVDAKDDAYWELRLAIAEALA